ncbi:right-handed parallel beta-helix repeat-containing protein [Scytonema sp. PCC 10023]|uniref:right-handed parallel beta-helix repeat-containing protein n=1 Tax=Scytonema sp. PCC 10023 TaxID=1680591 RepID=UPI0039C69B8E
MSFTDSQSQALQPNALTQIPDVITNRSNPQNSTLTANREGTIVDCKGLQDIIGSWTNNSSSGKDIGIDGNTQSGTLFGFSSNDQSLINNGNDNLNSGSNADLLIGDQGKDTLVGDSDVDQFTQDSSNLGSGSPALRAAPTATDNNSGTVYYVSPDGSDDNPGTSDKPWKSINYAVSEDSAIKAGDTILVQPGTYTELVTLGKSGSESGNITLKANGDVTVRDPDPIEGGFREGVIQSVGKGHWVIDGFRIEDTSWAGISLRDSNDITVQNNHTYNTGSSGIIAMPDSYFEGGEAEVTSKNIKVLNNTVEQANSRWKGGTGDNSISDPLGTQESLSIWGVDGFEVANNTVKDGTREGIDIKTGSRNGSVHDNYITGQASISGTYQGYQGGPALYIEANRSNSFNIDVYNNVVTGNVADGIVVADEVTDKGDLSDVRVYNNLVYGNGQEGVNPGRGIAVTSNVRNVEILNNTVANNVQAFDIDGSGYFGGGYKPTDVVLRNNIFADSTYRNGLIEDAGNVTLDNNLFTDKYENLYEGGTGIDNLNANNNTKVASVGFVNSGGNDYHLTSGSAAIDTGSSEIGQYAQRDKDGVERPQGAGVDIGAYES